MIRYIALALILLSLVAGCGGSEQAATRHPLMEEMCAFVHKHGTQAQVDGSLACKRLK